MLILFRNTGPQTPVTPLSALGTPLDSPVPTKPESPLPIPSFPAVSSGEVYSTIPTFPSFPSDGPTHEISAETITSSERPLLSEKPSSPVHVTSIVTDNGEEEEELGVTHPVTTMVTTTQEEEDELASDFIMKPVAVAKPPAKKAGFTLKLKEKKTDTK